VALHGDHFVVRDETAQRTLGGGVVIDPWARRHKRGEARLQDRLASLRTGEVPHLIESFLEENGNFAVPIEPIYHFLNLTEDETQGWIDRTKAIRTFSAEGEKVYTTENKRQILKEKLIKALQDFHGSHPLAAGMDMEEVRAKLAGSVSPRLFRELVEYFVKETAVSRDGNLLRLPEHHVELRKEDRTISEKVKALLGRSPLAPPDLKEIEKNTGVGRARLTEVIRVMERQGEIVRVTTDLYFLRESVDTVKGALYKYLEHHGEITAATFRDLLGSSRKYTIAFLEHFDRAGITVRVGDARRLKSPLPAGR
jgi:selenocysteine-specific elongation factor